jgi:VIT1/CCC1 family predicted Fe2+/Mn2+ transporter
MSALLTTDDPHEEKHKSQRAGWLRAAVLGANDGIVSTSSIMVGVAAATSDVPTILTAGIAGLVAGALSMGAGEYVSVSSQRDSERYDLDIERRSIEAMPEAEEAQLTAIYMERGLDEKLARQVARQLHEGDAVRAHARDELGINVDELARPWQAAFASMGSFTIGAAIPVLAALLVHGDMATPAIVVSSLLALIVTGAIGAYVGGGHRVLAALRVLLGGGLAMVITGLIGRLVGIAV